MDKQTTGRTGEDFAAEFLRSRGYEILGRNVRAGRGELDIVARRGDVLAFVEVKTRHAVPGVRSPYGTPAAAVNWKKQENLVKAAEEYLKRNAPDGEWRPRIDVIEVYLDADDRPSALEHYENAVRKRRVRRNRGGSYE